MSRPRSELNPEELKLARLKAKERRQKYRLLYPEKLREQSRKRVRSKEKSAQKQRERRKKFPERIRLQRARRKYGLSEERHLELLTKQENKCAICMLQPKKNLCVDHCHNTGKVRGLLCNACNRGIGYLGDNPDRIRRAIDYLKCSKKLHG
jgi:hypothetical protein